MQHKHRTLTRGQQAELRTLIRTGRGRLVLRARALLLLDAGKTFRATGEAMDADPQSVSAWCARYRAEGIAGLHDRRRSGAPRRLTKRAEKNLLRVVRKAPKLEGYTEPFWTCALLAEHLERRFQIALSDERVRVVLRRNGISFSRPKHRLVSPDPQYEEKRGLSRG